MGAPVAGGMFDGSLQVADEVFVGVEEQPLGQWADGGCRQILHDAAEVTLVFGLQALSVGRRRFDRLCRFDGVLVGRRGDASRRRCDRSRAFRGGLGENAGQGFKVERLAEDDPVGKPLRVIFWVKGVADDARAWMRGQLFEGGFNAWAVAIDENDPAALQAARQMH